MTDIDADRVIERVRLVRERSRKAVEEARARSAEWNRQAQRSKIASERAIEALRRAGYLRKKPSS